MEAIIRTATIAITITIGRGTTVTGVTIKMRNRRSLRSKGSRDRDGCRGSAGIEAVAVLELDAPDELAEEPKRYAAE
jgi:hypothetical protein